MANLDSLKLSISEMAPNQVRELVREKRRNRRDPNASYKKRKKERKENKESMGSIMKKVLEADPEEAKELLDKFQPQEDG